MKLRTTLALAAAASTLALTACGSDAGSGSSSAGSSPDAAGSTAASASGPLKVGVSPVPHGEILEYVKDNLAKDAGLDLQIVEFTDYVQPNVALDEGELDANYFQHQPYLDQQIKDAGYDLKAIVPVHLEPLGVYSKKVNSLDELADGATVAIPNDPTNGGRALDLLASEGVITLAQTDASATVLDVEDNPKNLKFTEVEAAQLPRSLEDVDAAVINGNYAIEADLSPAKDAIAVEKAEGNPYANLLVARADNADDPRIVKLGELLQSEQVKKFIEQKYAGAVIPAS